jgi:hypothetical protein
MLKRHKPSKGKIINEQAYIQGKVTESSSWYGFLPRMITPSDIDMIITEREGIVKSNNIYFDNGANGKVMFVEFNKESAAWDKISVGQARAYRNLVNIGQGKIYAALAKITPEPNKKIDTRFDVEEFSIMSYDELRGFKQSKIFNGKHWDKAVLHLIYEGKNS